ncbi:uncharacterized protein LACBIDRAFT_295147 [Laccaria bicolor S238N-H82]|uniref:Predicted protein n=1 Tax=Laccaria bicolor (strain S238N-H82 / ATCC MYA-4686) TaxID=486041 RepID=B0DNE8_LACBS|nr:uncharacterized protein LACBIDRAFT_295147 [Laccaria bicolor S238N-H82]EDR03858.1 predicted protein [Laccaria bicolor S238N-H82]|eukprot:XP_001885426.1 predicted protein [Laccaria bicolor S238N-H82]
MSLAGRPPYATDEPDSFYESAPTPRRNPLPKPEDPNKRTSAYNMYDSYLSEADKSLSPPSESQPNRNSGVSNLGMGLLNMADDSDSDDDSEDEAEQRRKRVAAASAGSSPSKHAALAAATQSPSPTRRQPSPTQQHTASQPRQQQQQQQRPPQQQQRPPQQQQPPQQEQQRPPQQQQQQPRPPQSPPGQPRPLQPIAAPRPGYAAPIAALNLAQPPPSLPPTGLGRLPPSANPFDPPAPPFPSSPSPSTPHPLQPPMTPIKPIFALPSSSPSSPSSSGGGGGPAVTFTTQPTPRKPIIRSNSEDPLLPGRGEKGDDFWRRFSMIAKEELAKPRGAKDSSWLKKTQNGHGRMNRWVGIVSVLLIICIVAAVGLGVYFNRNAPGHQQPKVFGGSADEVGSSVPGTPSASASAFHLPFFPFSTTSPPLPVLSLPFPSPPFPYQPTNHIKHARTSIIIIIKEDLQAYDTPN